VHSGQLVAVLHVVASLEELCCGMQWIGLTRFIGTQAQGGMHNGTGCQPCSLLHRHVETGV